MKPEIKKPKFTWEINPNKKYDFYVSHNEEPKFIAHYWYKKDTYDGPPEICNPILEDSTIDPNSEEIKALLKEAADFLYLWFKDRGQVVRTWVRQQRCR